MIGYLVRWTCPAAALRTRRRGPGLLGHRSWRPAPLDPDLVPTVDLEPYGHPLDQGGADLDGWAGLSQAEIEERRERTRAAYLNNIGRP